MLFVFWFWWNSIIGGSWSPYKTMYTWYISGSCYQNQEPSLGFQKHLVRIKVCNFPMRKLFSSQWTPLSQVVCFFLKSLITRNIFIPTEISHKAIYKKPLLMADVYNFTLFSLQKNHHPTNQNQPTKTNQPTNPPTNPPTTSLRLGGYSLMWRKLCFSRFSSFGHDFIWRLAMVELRLVWTFRGGTTGGRKIDAGRFWWFFVGSRWAPLQWS